MQLTPIAANQTEIETDNARVFFSYRTPVAAYVFGRGYVRDRAVLEHHHIQAHKQMAQRWIHRPTQM